MGFRATAAATISAATYPEQISKRRAIVQGAVNRSLLFTRFKKIQNRQTTDKVYSRTQNQQKGQYNQPKGITASETVTDKNYLLTYLRNRKGCVERGFQYMNALNDAEAQERVGVQVLQHALVAGQGYPITILSI